MKKREVLIAGLAVWAAGIAGCGRHEPNSVEGTWVLTKIGEISLTQGKFGYPHIELVLKPDRTFSERSEIPSAKGMLLETTGKYRLLKDKVILDGHMKSREGERFARDVFDLPIHRELTLRKGQLVEPADKPVMVYIRSTRGS